MTEPKESKAPGEAPAEAQKEEGKEPKGASKEPPKDAAPQSSSKSGKFVDPTKGNAILSEGEKTRKINKNKLAIESIINMLQAIPADNITDETREDLIRVWSFLKQIQARAANAKVKEEKRKADAMTKSMEAPKQGAAPGQSAPPGEAMKTGKNDQPKSTEGQQAPPPSPSPAVSDGPPPPQSDSAKETPPPPPEQKTGNGGQPAAQETPKEGAPTENAKGGKETVVEDDESVD